MNHSMNREQLILRVGFYAGTCSKLLGEERYALQFIGRAHLASEREMIEAIHEMRTALVAAGKCAAVEDLESETTQIEKRPNGHMKQKLNQNLNSRDEREREADPNIQTLDENAKTEQLAKVADHFNSDVTQFSGRDKNDKLLWIHVYAKGEAAAGIERYLKRVDRADAKRGKGAKP